MSSDHCTPHAELVITHVCCHSFLHLPATAAKQFPSASKRQEMSTCRNNINYFHKEGDITKKVQGHKMTKLNLLVGV